MKQKLTQTFYSGFLLFVLLAFSAVTAFSQSVTVRGTVSAKDGNGLAGVTVLQKGSKLSTTTDAQGNYAIDVPQNATLVFSFVGFTTQEVKVNGQSSIPVVLAGDNNGLTEVVVTAFGLKKEVKRVGYATQEIAGAELTKAREPNALNSLTGKIAGLTVGSSAEMLGRPQIVLRGSTDLLFVVDGVPVNSDTWNVSADDIETYTVLKGPNAAALYGFRGQNGAILITTKKGSRNKRGYSVDFNSSTMIEKGFIALPKNQTEYGYGNDYTYAYGNDLYDLDGSYRRTNIWGPKFDGQGVAQYDSPIDPATGIRTKTPWVARGVNNFEKFMQTGLLTTNNIAVAASGDKYDIRMSATHTYQKGMAPNTKLNIDNLSISAGYQISDRLRMDAGLNFNYQYTPNIPDVSYGPGSYQYQFKVYGSASWSIDDMRDYWKGPTGRKDLVQYYAEYGRENNPYFTAYEWLHGHYKTDVFGHIKLSYKVTNDLNVSLRTQVTTWDQMRSEKVPPSTNLNSYNNKDGYASYYFNKTNGVYNIWYGDYREDNRNLIESNSDLLLSYNKKVSDFTISANVGASFRSFKYNSNWASTYQLILPKVYTFANSKNPIKSYTFGSNMQVESGFYSVDLGYKNFINVNTTGRVDHLSTMPSGNQTFFYPSVSVSSAISDYVKLPAAISFLKVRGSYADVRGGLTSPTIGSSYLALYGTTLNSGLLGYGSETYSSYDGPNYNNQNVYTTNTYYNGTPSVSYSTNIASNEIKPFNVQSYEAGLDVKFLKNRLGAEFTYFRSTNGPLIYQLPVAPSTSYTTRSVNAITSLKKGWELSVSGAALKSSKGLNWDVLFNISTYRETLKDIYDGVTSLPINNHNYKVGERLDGYYGRKFVRSADGQIIHNGGLPLAPQAGIDNYQLLGYANPDFVFGLNNKFSFKNFSFSFQFDGRLGGKIYDYAWAQQMNGGNAIELVQGDYGAARLKEWQSTQGGTVAAKGAYTGKGVVISSGTPTYTNGVINNYDKLTFAENTTATTLRNYIQNGAYALFDEPFMISRSYLKLREIVFGYNFPSSMLGKGVFKSLSVSLVARNVLYFAARKDMDLDQYASGFNFSNLSLGGRQGDLQSSTARRYGFNINVGF